MVRPASAARGRADVTAAWWVMCAWAWLSASLVGCHVALELEKGRLQESATGCSDGTCSVCDGGLHCDAGERCTDHTCRSGVDSAVPPEGGLDAGADAADATPDGEVEPACELTCGHAEQCVLIKGRAICECLPAHQRVDGTCVPCGDGDAGPCAPSAACTESDGVHTCTCEPGFEDVHGDGSECIDKCALKGCLEGLATCSLVGGEAQCACIADYVGDGIESCEFDAECSLLGCHEHATCEISRGTRMCKCKPGYEGTGTECTKRDNCAPENPCQNGGECVDGLNGFSCRCPTGFTGVNCSQTVALTVDRADVDFGAREQGTTSTAVSWTITNTGTGSTSTLSLSNSNSSDFQIDGDCTGGIEAGESCTLQVRFAPSGYGLRVGTLTVGNSTSGTVQLALSGNSQVRLTVERRGDGAAGGTLSAPGGINCGSTCSALYDYGAHVTLRGNTANGSNSILSGWSSSDCLGPSRECTVTFSASMTVAATFESLKHNLIFVTSEAVPGDLGGTAAYDRRCNEVATQAGLNNTKGDGFIAVITDAYSDFASRLGSGVQGWVRLDGRPVGATITAMKQGAMYYPVVFDELGRATDVLTWSGENLDGPSFQNCNNWTSASSTSYASLGGSAKGPQSWIAWASFECNTPRPLLCMGKTRAAPLVPTVSTGKRIWLSESYRAGAISPDQRCFADRPSGVTNAYALVGGTDRTAASRLKLTANYVRPDGMLVGTGQQLVDKTILTGIWQRGNGEYYRERFPTVWSGAESLTSVGTKDVTCDNWTSPSGALYGNVGDLDTIGVRYWWTFARVPCDAYGVPSRVIRLYCVEP